MASPSCVADAGVMPARFADDDWIDGIDVSEHHCIDFDVVVRQGVRVVIVRAGRGTRQDARWIEHSRAAHLGGASVGSYWHVYPSHLDAHHQAELWMAAIGSARWALTGGHWADFSTADGFDAVEMGRYAAAFLRRIDELLGRSVGVFASELFWRRNVYFDITDRPRWVCAAGDDPQIDDPVAADPFAIRTRASDRGGPGRHRIHADPFSAREGCRSREPHLVPRRPDESVSDWQSRWIRTPEVAVLQEQLNRLGADLFVDGLYGPATDAAVRTCRLLCHRDGLEPPAFGSRSGRNSRPGPSLAF